ncbi:hypothetical protein [Mycolicibacterium conceptionense]|uniref:hypothetical protein n=1 Tax=Mycolicibacterium conceptionense TaxID=451644 RepID=UPI0007ED1FEE|nr:hypothetical protein [Mycolicibacterium conceptionense]OBK00935.1 hypothetical protein A5639_01620 [Mycolicibacterium conceptionense]
MAKEIGNVEGTPDPDSTDGEFPKPLPEWLVQATDEFMARPLEDQVAFILHCKSWCQARGNLEGAQYAEDLLKGLVYELAHQFALKDLALGAS